MTRSIHALLLALALGSGCALDVPRLEDPTLDGSLAGAGLHQVARAEWEAAEAGCEDAPIAELHLAGCEGEPALGALLDADGKVVCVDAMSTLRDELDRETPPEPLHADPSPQPSRAMRVAAPLPISGHATSRPDPTPTPVVHADPTPTPITNPDLVAPRIPIEERPPEEDPTPTPTMEQ